MLEMHLLRSEVVEAGRHHRNIREVGGGGVGGTGAPAGQSYVDCIVEVIRNLKLSAAGHSDHTNYANVQRAELLFLEHVVHDFTARSTDARWQRGCMLTVAVRCCCAAHAPPFHTSHFAPRCVFAIYCQSCAITVATAY
jgi:hypothetical protein